MMHLSRGQIRIYECTACTLKYDLDVFFISVYKSSEVPKAFTRGITFRLASEMVARLQRVSEAKSISPNTLVNQIIKAHLDLHSLAAHAKLYYLPKSFLIRLINELAEEELKEIARDTAKNDLVDISLVLRGGFTLASISSITETWLRIAHMPYRYEIDRKSCKIIIEHDMGYKYSYLIKEISMYILEVAFGSNSSCDVTENVVIIKLEQQSHGENL